MYNFFFKGADHSLFQKAMKSTKDEAVIINILSTDSSLKEEVKKDEAPVVRKNLSNKFQPSPFGKFFGPRKQRTTPVDMGSFSSWKNKNFREAEQKLGETEAIDTPRFSLSDYLNKSADKKYNDEDQLKADTQKPITQLASDDPIYRKYSLDSYLHKLEEQAKVKDKFQSNDDLLEPLGDSMQNVVPDSSQDENFGADSVVNVEDFTFDENITGEKFAFEKSELDRVRSRLDKLERDSQDKQTEKIISGNELSSIAGDSDDNFDFDKLGVGDDDDDDSIQVDDIEKINEKLGLEAGEVDELKKPKRTFFEINKTPTGAAPKVAAGAGAEQDESAASTDKSEEKPETNETDSTEAGAEEPAVTGTGAGVIIGGTSGIVGEQDSNDGQEASAGTETDESLAGGQEEFVTGTKVSRDDILTKDDLRTMTDELVTKFTEMYKKGGEKPLETDENVEGETDVLVKIGEETTGTEQPYDYSQGYVDPSQQYVDPNATYPYAPQQTNEQLLQQQQVELQTKILEMIEANKRSDAEAADKLRLAEMEKNRVTEEYENRLRELEASFRKRDEEMKKQAYLDKLKNDIKLKKAETNFRKREEEIKELEKVSSERVKIGVMLKKELANNLNVSNLEMDKKLLEVASKIRKEEIQKQKIEEPQIPEEIPDIEEEEVEETPKKTTTKKTTTTSRRRTGTRRTSRSHTRTPRRKIDSDIIGGIKFD